MDTITQHFYQRHMPAGQIRRPNLQQRGVDLPLPLDIQRWLGPYLIHAQAAAQ